MRGKILLVLMLLIFTVGCNRPLSGQKPEETALITDYIRSGTEGLRMKFAQDYPRKQMYDQTPLTAIIELENKGTYDLNSANCKIRISGFDTSIVKARKDELTIGCEDLEGKSAFNPNGGLGQVEFTSSTINLPQETDKYKMSLTATACYKYQTVLGSQMCVDSNFYGVKPEQKACRVRNPDVGSGQGAPVTVDSINMQMVGDKAILEISISNRGKGRVIKPGVTLSNVCPTNLRYSDFDEVRFTLEVPGSGLTVLKCTPKENKVRLINNRGKIFCTVSVPSGPAFETPFSIKLDYSYVDSISAPVEIIRTPS